MLQDLFETDRQERLFSGVVKTTPVSLSDKIYVTIPGIDGGAHFYGPCPWEPRVGTGGVVVMPTGGNRCIIALDDEDDPWVVAWWPYA